MQTWELAGEYCERELPNGRRRLLLCTIGWLALVVLIIGLSILIMLGVVVVDYSSLESPVSQGLVLIAGMLTGLLGYFLTIADLARKERKRRQFPEPR